MGAILHKLWNDPDYFRKSLVLALGAIITILPFVPFETLGKFGYWAKEVGMPVLVAFAATVRGSGLSQEEAAKLRALIPTSDQLDEQVKRKMQAGGK